MNLFVTSDDMWAVDVALGAIDEVERIEAVEVLLEGILLDTETFVLVARVLGVVAYFMVVMGFVGKMTNLVVSATGLKIIVKLVAAFIFLQSDHPDIFVRGS